MSRRMPLVAFVTVALGLLASAGLLHRWMRQGAHEHAGAELDAVAAVKVAAINAWRAEHVGAAAYAATYPSVARAAAASARGKLDPGLVAHVHEVLEHLAERRGFLRIGLLAPDGRALVEWVGPGDPGVPFGPELLRASTGSPEGTSWVLASAPGRRRPVLDAAAAVPVEGSATLAVALRVAMGPFFDDVIQKWPVPSPSGTTGLVRRDGDQVVVCASGDGAGAAPPPALLPLSDERLPAVQAALGRTGVVQGVDVRGTPVLAAIRPVPGTDWKLVTRKDVSEAEAPMQAPFTAIASLVAMLLAAAGVMLFLWWRGERAREAMQAQLERAERLASLGTLAAGVAHEINNPLAYVLTNLEFALSRLAESGAPREDLEALAEARDGAARVRDVVRGLRAFSRPGAGRRGPADAGAELQTALRLASNDIRRRARLETSLQPVPRVVSGEHELGQVFLNLLLNAAQAIPEGRAGENVVRVESGTDAAGWARIVVQDSGVGIPPEVQRRIFEPFFTTKPLGTGTGLGLAIAHSVVVAAGGRIEVESEVGKGATFRVLLPPAPVQAAEPETAPVTGPGPAGEAG